MTRFGFEKSQNWDSSPLAYPGGAKGAIAPPEIFAKALGKMTLLQEKTRIA